LNLTINYSTSSNTSQTACNSYTWNGTTYTTSGQYYFASTNASGCSNIDTLNLTINYSTSSNTSQTACNSYTWNGTTYTTSGQYYFASTNASGCSNIDTLNLTINYSTSSNTSQTACDSFTWNGTTYTTSGQYYFASTNASGCSNIDTLNLTINVTPASPTITTSTLNVTVPATAVAYSCSTVSGTTTYTWSYTGTGVTIVSGQGTENITADFAANATNGDMQVVASNGNCVSLPTSANIILPVTLSNFTATKVGKTALLQWTTSSEINSKNFEVQRSIDGRNFVTIATVAAKGFASDYSFTDLKPFIENNYYRLKQVDRDGRFEYSAVRTVNFKAENISIVIYPNPVADILNVRISNGSAKQVNIINTLGKIVYTTIAINANGVVQIPVSNLNAGTYFVEILSNETRTVEKFVKR
ncbi:MAG: T9SS type A sorting domain-containing protein, partial [Chitinophagaceae bacterium]